MRSITALSFTFHSKTVSRVEFQPSLLHDTAIVVHLIVHNCNLRLYSPLYLPLLRHGRNRPQYNQQTDTMPFEHQLSLLSYDSLRSPLTRYDSHQDDQYACYQQQLAHIDSYHYDQTHDELPLTSYDSPQSCYEPTHVPLALRYSNQYNHTCSYFSHPTPPSTPPPFSEPFNNPIAAAQADLSYLKRDIEALATDYRLIGQIFHTLPLHIRYHYLVRNTGMATDARKEFTIADDREIPEMISLLGMCEMVVHQVESMLRSGTRGGCGCGCGCCCGCGQGGGGVDWQGVGARMRMLEQQITYARVVVAKLDVLVKFYLKVVVPRVRHDGWGLSEKKINYHRGIKIGETWRETLPAVCWRGFV